MRVRISFVRKDLMALFLHISRRENSFPWWKVVSLLLFFTSLPVSSAFPWGREGHEYINKNAALKAAGLVDFPSFVQSHRSIQIITYNGPEPDRWKRSADYSRRNGHGLAHYINLDLAQDRPPARDHIAGIQMYQEKGVDGLAVGLLPYYIVETYERLRLSFAEYRDSVKRGSDTAPVETNILYYAGVLGHYVGDGSQPLHTTAHHHGWVGENPNGHAIDKGIHQRFESDFVRNIKAEDFFELLTSPSRLCGPFEETINYLKKTHSFMERVYEFDTTGALSDPTVESLQFGKERLAAASQMLVNLWYTAWLESERAEVGNNVSTTDNFANGTH